MLWLQTHALKSEMNIRKWKFIKHSTNLLNVQLFENRHVSLFVL